MVAPKARERRVGRRVEGDFRVDLDPKQFGTLLQVGDVSLSGVSFHLTKPVEYMTRVQMVLWLPDAMAPGRSGEYDCAGVVVRCEETPLTNGGTLPDYEVAVFFTELPDATGTALQNYVTAQPQADRSAT